MSVPATEARELFVRYARRDGRPVAVLRAFAQDGSFVVAGEVFPQGSSDAATAVGPYSFPDEREAAAFVTDAAEALTYLGCDVDSTR